MKAPAIADALLRSPLWRPAESAHLWMWATTNHLREALGVIEALGFRYVTHFVWVKRQSDGLGLQLGLGQYLRHAHELCLFGTQGPAMVPCPERRLPSVLFAPRGRHSEKPRAAFDLFEEISPAPRAEFFARSKREGWEAWGNEL
jgi:N6-adenosine-specific RNA methylase IME4